MVKPCFNAGYVRPDELSEFYDGVSDGLRRALWESLESVVPVNEQINMEDSSPGDAVGINSLAVLWNSYTEEQQIEINRILSDEEL